MSQTQHIPLRPCEGCVILVLAAGKGTRMGGPKALMDVRGAPWWVHQQIRLLPLGGMVKWIVSREVNEAIRHGAEGVGTVRRVTVDSGAPMFLSVLAGIRPLGINEEAIDTGVVSEAGAGVFVLPVDVPVPLATTWESLRAGSRSRDDAEPGSTGTPRVPTFRSTRGHPVFLPFTWIRSALLPQLPNLKDWDPERPYADIRGKLDSFRLDRLIEPSRVEVPVVDPGVLVNLNSPGELDSWLHESEPQRREH